MKQRFTASVWQEGATIPNHREVTVGTIRSILRQAGIDPEEFEVL